MGRTTIGKGFAAMGLAAFAGCETVGGIAQLGGYAIGALPAEGFSIAESEDYGLVRLTVGGYGSSGLPLIPPVSLLASLRRQRAGNWSQVAWASPALLSVPLSASGLHEPLSARLVEPAIHLDGIPCMDLLSPAGLDLSVDQYFSALDEHLGMSSSLGDVQPLEQLVKADRQFHRALLFRHVSMVSHLWLWSNNGKSLVLSSLQKWPDRIVSGPSLRPSILARIERIEASAGESDRFV
jgi:hypothetical protein